MFGDPPAAPETCAVSMGTTGTPRRADARQAGFLCQPAVAAGQDPALRQQTLRRGFQVEAGAVDDALIDAGAHVLAHKST